MKEKFCFDLHIHSRYSIDSFLTPEKIVKRATSIGLNAIAITDHNTINGSKVLQAIKQDSLLIISGSEIATDYGDLIGLFINEEIKSRRFEEVIDEIKDQDGIVVLPHPYRRKRCPSLNLIKMVDVIEGINSRTSDEDNNKAKVISESLHKPMIAGSDAHTMFEIGNAWTFTNNSKDLDDDRMREIILTGNTQMGQNKSCQYRQILQAYSKCIKYLKKVG